MTTCWVRPPRFDYSQASALPTMPQLKPLDHCVVVDHVKTALKSIRISAEHVS